MEIGKCPDYAEALRGLWPPSDVVLSEVGDEGIRFPFTGGDATWGCVNPLFLFPLALERKSSPIIRRRPPRLFLHVNLRSSQRRRRG